MKLLLESAAFDAIRWGYDTGFVDGVYLTPGALDRDAFGLDPVEHVDSISRLSGGTVLVALGAVAADDLHRVGREYARLADHIVVAVPFVEDGVTALRRLSTEGVRTAASFVVTASQALLAAKAGASCVCVAADALDAHGHDPTGVLRDIRSLFDRHGIESDVVAIAAESPRLATVALSAGADASALTPEALRAMLHHPITDRALDHLLGEVSRRPRPRGVR